MDFVHARPVEGQADIVSRNIVNIGAVFEDGTVDRLRDLTEQGRAMLPLVERWSRETYRALRYAEGVITSAVGDELDPDQLHALLVRHSGAGALDAVADDLMRHLLAVGGQSIPTGDPAWLAEERAPDGR